METGFGQDLLNADIQLDGDRVFDDVETGSILGRIDPDVLELPRFNITPTKVCNSIRPAIGHLPIHFIMLGVPKNIRF